MLNSNPPAPGWSPHPSPARGPLPHQPVPSARGPGTRHLLRVPTCDVLRYTISFSPHDTSKTGRFSSALQMNERLGEVTRLSEKAQGATEPGSEPRKAASRGAWHLRRHTPWPPGPDTQRGGHRSRLEDPSPQMNARSEEPAWVSAGWVGAKGFPTRLGPLAWEAEAPTHA